MDDERDVTTTLRISNSMSVPVNFHLEPWGEPYLMQPGQSFTVVACGLNNPPEIVISEDDIFYWAGAGTTVRLYAENQELGPSETERTRTPDAPTKPLRAVLGLP